MQEDGWRARVESQTHANEPRASPGYENGSSPWAGTIWCKAATMRKSEESSRGREETWQGWSCPERHPGRVYTLRGGMGSCKGSGSSPTPIARGEPDRSSRTFSGGSREWAYRFGVPERPPRQNVHARPVFAHQKVAFPRGSGSSDEVWLAREGLARAKRFVSSDRGRAREIRTRPSERVRLER